MLRELMSLYSPGYSNSDSDPSLKHDVVTTEGGRARETPCHFHPCHFTAPLSLEVTSHPKVFSFPSSLQDLMQNFHPCSLLLL